MKPMEIEEKSMETIERELRENGFYEESRGRESLAFRSEEEMAVIKRCIHASADFDYAENLTFSEDAVSAGLKALKEGAVIVTDTNMAAAGINKKACEGLGVKVRCFVADEDVAREAKERGTTRAVVSMERTASLKEQVIFAGGNAPTALIRLRKMIDEGEITREHMPLIIGVPVGFVNVVESKNMIVENEEIPYIVAKGRKGGSSIAVAICNALLYLCTERE